jgi:hypothetical protein
MARKWSTGPISLSYTTLLEPNWNPHWTCVAGGMTDTALRDEMNTLIIAGAETTAISLSFTCALLAQHPAVRFTPGFSPPHCPRWTPTALHCL